MTSVEAKLRVGKIQKYKERRFSDRRVCLFLLIMPKQNYHMISNDSINEMKILNNY